MDEPSRVLEPMDRIVFFFVIENQCQNMRHAALTVVRNEKFFLPIWVKYYSEQLGVENLYVVDNESNDGSTEPFKSKIKVLKRKSQKHWDGEWRCLIRRDVTKLLLKEYESVVVTDVDEIISPDMTKWSGLKDYLDKCSQEFVSTNSWEVIQENEPEINPNKPLLRQRKLWQKPHLNWGKVAVIRSPINFGIHTYKNDPNFESEDKDLYLIHLSRIDWKVSLQRNLDRLCTYKPLSDRHGERILNTDKSNHILYSTRGYNPTFVVEKIPEHLKDVI